ncbi:MAG: hypothetical protein EA378_03225 [Phycisphaerales bacterium]|nr:MAG: hypothetical protein EA378_03225 [Phycisphaerales bacterium]
MWRIKDLNLDAGSIRVGHASLATTIRYLDHLCPAAVVRAITQGNGRRKTGQRERVDGYPRSFML